MPRSRLALAIIVMMSSVFMLAVGESMFARPTLGQVAPAAPGQPLPLATIGALPALAPAPGTQVLPTPIPQFTPVQFTCSCSGPGSRTTWVGKVPAASYILASQAASGACTAYNINAHAESPYIKPPGSTLTQPPGVLYAAPPGMVGTFRASIPPNEPLMLSEEQQVVAACQRCACN